MKPLLYKACFLAAAAAIAGCDQATPAEKPDDLPAHVTNGFHVINASPEQKILYRRYFNLSDRFDKLLEGQKTALENIELAEEFPGEAGRMYRSYMVHRGETQRRQTIDTLNDMESFYKRNKGKLKSFNFSTLQPCQDLERFIRHEPVDMGRFLKMLYPEGIAALDRLRVDAEKIKGDAGFQFSMTQFSDLDMGRKTLDEFEKSINSFEQGINHFRTATDASLPELNWMTLAIRGKSLQVDLMLEGCTAGFEKMKAAAGTAVDKKISPK